MSAPVSNDGGQQSPQPHTPGQVFHPTRVANPSTAASSQPTAFDVDKHEAAANFSEAQLQTARQAAAAANAQPSTPAAPAKVAKNLSLTQVLGIAWVIAFVPAIVISFVLNVMLYTDIYQSAARAKPVVVKAMQIIDAHEANPDAKPIAELTDTERQTAQDFFTKAPQAIQNQRAVSGFTSLLSIIMSVVAVFYMKRQGVPKTWTVFIVSLMVLGFAIVMLNNFSSVQSVNGQSDAAKSAIANETQVERVEKEFSELKTPAEFTIGYIGYLLLAAGISQLTFQLVGHWRNKGEY